MRAATLALIAPLAVSLAACGGSAGDGGQVAATIAAPAAATGAAPAGTVTAPVLPKGEWAFAPGAGTKGVANVGTATAADGSSKTVTRVFIVDAATEANRSLQYVDGSWNLPVPVAGAEPEGLSWNGRRAVLASTDGPSRFITFRPAKDMSSSDVATDEIDLADQGTFRFDALSRDGAWLYLAQSKDAAGNAVDKIRAYDLVRGTLLADPVVDKAGGAEAMAGTPVVRAFAPDGNAVYTVYEGPQHPFVHGLLTGDRISVCIDLDGAPATGAAGAWTMRWTDPGRTLEITSERLHKTFTITVQDDFPTLTGTRAG